MIRILDAIKVLLFILLGEIIVLCLSKRMLLLLLLFVMY